MSVTQRYMPPDLWMRQIFEAKAARDGGIVRRKLRDVERNVGRAAFVAEVERRGYHCVENGGQLIIFCNNEPVQVVC